MTTAENFLLVMTDPATGKALIGSAQSDAVLGGAILLDLVAAGRLALDGRGRKARVVVTDNTPLADPALQVAFERLRAKRPLAPQTAVTVLGKKGRARSYEALAAKGAVRPRTVRVMGLFSVTRHDVIDTARRAALREHVRSSLLHDQPVDEVIGPIIGLLSAADLTKTMVDKPDRRRAKARAKIVSEGDWASEGVRQAIRAAQSAVTAAVVAATVAGTAGSS